MHTEQAKAAVSGQAHALWKNSACTISELIREKDGIWLFRMDIDGQPMIAKYFSGEHFRREIVNYSILNSLILILIKKMD